jgi:integrase
VDQGIDPRARPGPVDIVAGVLAEFIKRDQQPRNRHWRQVERILNRDLTSWLERDIRSITRRDVLDVLDAIVDRGSPIQANRTLAWCRRMLAWTVERGILETSPAAGIRPPGREIARDRVLEPGELVAVWRAATALPKPFPGLMQMFVLTAARQAEVVHMRGAHIDLAKRLWTVPREFTKADRAHEIPLSDLALEIIGLPGEGLVFPGQQGGPVRQFGKAKAKLDRLSGVTGWRLHDLRRTAASGMARLGYPPHVVAAILNHAPASTMGITAIYNRHRYGDEKRAALEAWSREIERLLGRGEAKVVRLTRTI